MVVSKPSVEIRGNLMRRLLSAGVAVAFLVSGVAVAPTATALTWPDCNTITQPSLADPVITADGVQFTWVGGSQPVNDYFVWVNRKVNGSWIGGNFLQDIGKNTTYFQKWVDGTGLRAEALFIAPFIYCYGEPRGPNQEVSYAEWEAIEAQQKAEEQAAIDALVAAQLAEQQQAAALAAQQEKAKKKKRIECVNKKTDEIKIFAKKKCPKRWKKY